MTNNKVRSTELCSTLNKRTNTMNDASWIWTCWVRTVRYGQRTVHPVADSLCIPPSRTRMATLCLSVVVLNSGEYCFCVRRMNCVVKSTNWSERRADQIGYQREKLANVLSDHMCSTCVQWKSFGKWLHYKAIQFYLADKQKLREWIFKKRTLKDAWIVHVGETSTDIGYLILKEMSESVSKIFCGI